MTHLFTCVRCLDVVAIALITLCLLPAFHNRCALLRLPCVDLVAYLNRTLSHVVSLVYIAAGKCKYGAWSG